MSGLAERAQKLRKSARWEDGFIYIGLVIFGLGLAGVVADIKDGELSWWDVVGLAALMAVVAWEVLNRSRILKQVIALERADAARGNPCDSCW